ncbi:NACHT and WD repeat domain-containing protein [Streptomyces sp. NBC_00435]|uniref:NACHT and WD repeat domain-containing protein n=1 Tax=Streptomyces sp. NBC_00435 TaxID=2903649 RepID=UPI002E204153
MTEYDYESEEFGDSIRKQVSSVQNWFANDAISHDERFIATAPVALETVRDITEFTHREKLFECEQEDVLVVYITGHGARSNANRHFLLLPQSDDSKLMSTAFPTADLVGAILDSEAQHVLVIVDSCYAGSLDAELANRLQDLSPDRFGMETLVVVTSGDFTEQPRVGEFTEVIDLAVQKICDEAKGFAGPTISYQDWETVLREVATERRDLISVRWVWPRSRSDAPSPCLPNPRYWLKEKTTFGAPESESSHPFTPSNYWITRASGTSSENDVAWHFTGRQKIVEEIQEFLRSGEGVCLVTGEAGSGKSAIIGHLVVHGNARIRSDVPQDILNVLETSSAPPVDIAVLARNKSTASVSQEIRTALLHISGLGIERATSLSEEIESTRSTLGRPVAIAIDGVDEAADPDSLIGDLLHPLVRDANRLRKDVRVLVGVRSPRSTALDGTTAKSDHLIDEIARVINTPFYSEGVPSLLFDDATEASEIESANTIFLRTDEDGSHAEITRYALSLLSDKSHPKSPYLMAPDSALEVAEAISRQTTPSFLNTRLAADRARNRPTVQNVEDPEWIKSLQDGTVALLHSDLEEVAENSGIDPGDLLAALQATAFSCGPGLPWADVWAAILNAIFGNFTRDASDVIKAIRSSRLNGYLATDISDNRIVYRPSHERIAENLRSLAVGENRVVDEFDLQGHMESIHAKIAASLSSITRSTLPYPPHPYIRRYLVQHAALGAVLDDGHVPLSFLEWETSRRVGSLLPSLNPVRGNINLHAWARIERHLVGVELASQRVSHAFHLTALGGTPPPLAGWLHPKWARWEVDSGSASASGSGGRYVSSIGGLAFVAVGGEIQVRDLSTGVNASSVPAGLITEMCVTGRSGNPVIATSSVGYPGSRHRGIRFWDPFSKQELERIECGRIRQLKGLAGDSPAVAAISRGCGDEVVAWDIETRKVLFRSHGVRAGSYCITNWRGNPSDVQILIADMPSKDSMMHVWNARSGVVEDSFRVGPVGRMMSVKNSDGRSLVATEASPYGDRGIKIWDIESGVQVRSIDVGPVRSMCTVPSGRGREFLVTVGWDHVLRLIDLWSGQELEEIVMSAPVAAVVPVQIGEKSPPAFLLSGPAGSALISMGRTGVGVEKRMG